MDPKAFKDFFEPYAKNVDQADSAYFWKLSDRLIMAIIQQHIPTTLAADGVILDAGGGTGRWIKLLSTVYQSHFVLYDLSEDMLAQAQKHFDATLAARVQIVQGDLQAMTTIADDSIDHVVSIYSPLSFVDEPAKAIAELYRIVKPGGRVILMGHSYYNALASKMNNYAAAPEELERLNGAMRVKWAPHVPELNVFSCESFEKLLSGAGFTPVATYGVPVFAQPGAEDFDPSNQKRSRISDMLEKNQDFFDKVFAIEMEHNSKPEVANRGVNIFAVGQKGNA